jgi:hypothetical protein
MILPEKMEPVDDIIDATFGEQVVMRPMMVQQTGYREAVPDPSRLTVIAIGIYDQQRGIVEPTGGGSIHQQATAEVTLSIRHEHTEKAQLQKGDRVFFPERDELYDVSFIHPDPGGRPDVHLLRVLDD